MKLLKFVEKVSYTRTTFCGTNY